MSDLFHPDVPPWFVCEVWQVMRECPQHLFQILTKRPRRMLRLIETYIADHEFGVESLSNVWLGVSVENQATADERIPLLLQTPAAVRFVSCEPLLGPIDIGQYLSYYPILPDVDPGYDGISWTICGGESGPGARPMHPDWARSLRDQCQGAGTPFFFKQWGAYRPYDGHGPAPTRFNDGMGMICIGKKAAGRLLDGREWNEMPEALDDA